MTDSGERQSRRGRAEGAPGTEDQFKRGAAATGSSPGAAPSSAADPSSGAASSAAAGSPAGAGPSTAEDVSGRVEEADEVPQADGGGGEPRDDGQVDTHELEVPETERLLEEQREKYLRLAADYDNYRKRTAKERQEAGTRAQAELVKQLIDSLDDLARFAHLDPAALDATTLVEGVELVEKKVLKALGAAGLEVLDPVDQTFDPAVHEAVATEPALSPEDENLISRVYQQGYLFKGLLLRPARVVVRQWNG